MEGSVVKEDAVPIAGVLATESALATEGAVLETAAGPASAV